MEEPLAELKTAIAGGNLEEIKDVTDKVMAVMQTVGAKMYEAAAAEADGGTGASSDAPDDDEVVDAEIVEDDEDGDA